MTALPSARWSDWSCAVRVTVTDAAALAPAEAIVRTAMQEVELAVSRFRSGSELSRANWLAGCPLPVSRTFVDFLDVALAAAAQTGGLVDPLLATELVAAGYDRDIAAGPGPGGAVLAHPTWRRIRLDRAAGIVRVPRGAGLDLGATAKAHTADICAAAVRRRLDTCALVEIGGDVAVAGAPDGGWRVDVAERAGDPAQPVGLHSGGIATSTTTVRTWTVGGVRRHHLIDPRTGRPADGPWRTVSVAADSALAANVASTAALVLGPGAGAWLQSRELAARLVDRGGHVTYLGAWPRQPSAPRLVPA